MKTKTVAMLFLSVLLLFAVGGYSWYENTFQSVSFVLKVRPLTVTVLDASDKTVSTISADSTLILANGDYKAKPSGKNLDSTPILFTVRGGDKTVVINPPFSDEYFNGLLKDDISAINAAIVDTYPRLIPKYTIHRGELQQRGDWYVTALSNKSSTNDSPKDVYKITLNKDNGNWKVVDSPQIVPTIYNMPNVPKSVISNAYNFTPKS